MQETSLPPVLGGHVPGPDEGSIQRFSELSPQGRWELTRALAARLVAARPMGPLRSAPE